MRIAFLGTPAFAESILEALIQCGQYSLCVFTQPDRPVGRKAVLTPPPVKLLAERHGLPVYQFDRISDALGVQALRGFAPDFVVTAAFGQKLSDEILSIPRLESVNVHASLLPRYRGASPIQSCILNGDAQTGVTVMRMVSRMDAGEIFSSVSTPILPAETADELSERLAQLGARLLLDTLPRLAAGNIVPTAQDPAQVSVCRKLTRESGRIGFLASAQQVHDLVRGTNSWPGAYALLDGVPLKIHRTRIVSAAPLGQCLPGQIYGGEREGMFVACGADAVELLEVQYAGGKRMSGTSFLRGHTAAVGVTLV